MKAEGVTAGVADLILLVPKKVYGCRCIERRTGATGARKSPEQKAWQKATEEAGNIYAVVRTLEDFQAIVNDYMMEKR